MRVLLDTHVLLWALMEPDKLPPGARTTIESPRNEVLFSAASIWEIAVKAALGRVDFRVHAAEIARAATASGFTELPVWSAAAARVAELPMHHRDPFDRLLVAQAMSEPAKLYTVDPRLGPYTDLVQRL
jgi:PIN domain nuclease of toxin-antitoxin system